MKTFANGTALPALLLLLAGCSAVPNDPRPDTFAAPPAYRHADRDRSAAPPAAIDTPWWSAFADPALASLIEQATRDNPDLAAAAARLAQAQALIGQARSQQRPQVGAGAQLERGRTGDGSATRSQAGLGLTLDFEVDLFGRLAGITDTALLDAQSQAAVVGAVRVAVQAAVAQTYFAVRAAEREQRLVAGTAEAYRGTLALTERRFAAGDVAELEVVRIRGELAATEAEVQALQRSRATLEHALAALVGAAPSSLALAEAAGDPVTLPAVPVGLPSELLQRRADVVAADLDLQAAHRRVGVARSAWFPSLALTGSGGVASSDLSELLTRGARAWGVGALLSLPIFDGGRREAGVQQAQGALDEAHARYRSQVLSALREVDDQLVALQTLNEQARVQAVAVAAAARASALSSTRWRNGLVSQLELLDAQRSELRYRRAALQVDAAREQATVALVRALGGGWAPQTVMASSGRRKE